MKFVKVFGERNTGTNFLTRLLRINTALEVLDHGTNQNCVDQTKSICRAGNITSQLAQQLILERMIDAQRAKEYTQNFGWKHAAVSWQMLKQSDRYDETIFICLIRNPWRFLTALYRRPYHLLPEPSGDFSSFLRSPLVANGRDGLDDAFLRDPIELWNQKVTSYHRLQQKSSQNVLVVYYEQVVDDIDAFFHQLGPFCGQEFGAISIPANSTKGDIKNFRDYRLEAQTYHALNEMSQADAEYIANRVDQHLIPQSPYRSMAHSLSQGSRPVGRGLEPYA